MVSSLPAMIIRLRRSRKSHLKVVLFILSLIACWAYWTRPIPRNVASATYDNVDVKKYVAEAIRKQEPTGDRKSMFTPRKCKCARFERELSNLKKAKVERTAFDPSVGKSTCSEFATLRGGGQKVVSYSYYPTSRECPVRRKIHFEIYLGQLYDTIADIKKFYPDWTVRIYHNVTSDYNRSNDELCRIYCDHDNVDLCHVYDLPELGNLTDRGVMGKFWRFSVMGDPTVDVFMCRDTDSWVLEREAAAVKEWLNSGKTYHVMHDHPKHQPVIMSGLWGAFNRAREYLQQVRDFMFIWPAADRPSYDNEMLRILLWPVMKDDVMNHDSFTCEVPSHGPSVPFPTRREGRRYCGWGSLKTVRAEISEKSECPYECRPKDHKDWSAC